MYKKIVISLFIISAQNIFGKEELGKLVFSCKTSKQLVNVNKQGSERYVYFSWNLSKNKPETTGLEINNGTWIPDGSGGNGHYTFKKNDHSYVLYDSTGVCADYCGYYLEIKKNGKTIINEKCRPES